MPNNYGQGYIEDSFITKSELTQSIEVTEYVPQSVEYTQVETPPIESTPPPVEIVETPTKLRRLNLHRRLLKLQGKNLHALRLGKNQGLSALSGLRLVQKLGLSGKLAVRKLQEKNLRLKLQPMKKKLWLMRLR